ncbi:GDSL-type esterase/lipase family protein [Arthrobacter sp. SA17]
MLACSTSVAACDAALTERRALLTQALIDPASSPLVTDLAATIDAIQAKAPNATVYVTGYPLLFDPGFPNPGLALAVNSLTVMLNMVIENVAEANDAVYVDVAGAFAGHGIGSGTPGSILIHSIPRRRELASKRGGIRGVLHGPRQRRSVHTLAAWIVEAAGNCCLDWSI